MKNGTNQTAMQELIERLKRNIETIELGLDKILQLNPVKFNWVDGFAEDGKDMLGFIAQEVKDFIPQAYVQSEDFIGLNYNAIVAALVKSVQELEARIKQLENK